MEKINKKSKISPERKKLLQKIKKEGNEHQFEAHGLKCLIKRQISVGHWCGYVEIPKKSRLLNANYFYYTKSELGLSDFEQAINNIDVHGGITFTGTKIDLTNKSSTYWGFDCSHSYDHVPFILNNIGIIPLYEKYRDKKYVIQECTKLARQIKQITELYPPTK